MNDYQVDSDKDIKLSVGFLLFFLLFFQITQMQTQSGY